MAKYKTHTVFNFFILPFLVLFLIRFFNSTFLDLLTFSICFIYSTLFMNPDLDLVNEIGLPAVVSGSLDTSVGLSSGIALAASIPHLYGACGLGTGTLFAQDLVTPTTLPVNGELPVRRATPDAHLLASAASQISESDRLWWQQRIVRAWNSGAKDLVTPSVREAIGQ